jgi:hypothetical protein
VPDVKYSSNGSVARVGPSGSNASEEDALSAYESQSATSSPTAILVTVPRTSANFCAITDAAIT